jgi:hypothetical protein
MSTSSNMVTNMQAMPAEPNSNETALSSTSLEPGYYEETSMAIQYAGLWEVYNGVEPSGGSVRYTYDPAATITFTLNGQSLMLYLTRRPDGGPVTVCIDQQCQLMDTWSPDTRWIQPVSFVGLNAGIHQVEIRKLSSAYLDLDAIRVFEQPYPEMVSSPTQTPTGSPTPVFATATADLVETPTPTADVVVIPTGTPLPDVPSTETATMAPSVMPTTTETSSPTPTNTPLPTETSLPTAEPSATLAQ